MSDIGFFADIRYSDIVQLLLSDSDINRYRYEALSANSMKKRSELSQHVKQALQANLQPANQAIGLLL